MFYDTLQQLCEKKNLLQFNKERIQKDKEMANVLKQFGMAGG